MGANAKTCVYVLEMPEVISPASFATPLLNEYGTYATVTARFWSELSSKRPQALLSCSLCPEADRVSAGGCANTKTCVYVLEMPDVFSPASLLLSSQMICDQPLPGEKRRLSIILKTFALKMAQVDARVWP